MFERIVTRPDLLGGKPCIRGTRISVEFVLELFASGASRADVLEAYPQLQSEDIAEALRFAASSVTNDLYGLCHPVGQYRSSGQTT
jgi:uncharacterized protein (DUF433 family)